ncbi:ATP-binding protein [Rhizobium sp. BK251]|uniref:sensor histidine kinase n=1 Tax=Rhizobium sp. BK251 TaxID=2512125 RepID=UPI00104DA0DF|nr:ATP-binding protein [Rhizobium sp. BK251]TCL71781.1 two-component system OmpR family sensor kinase/two-component system sensor histidine kinase QseC [Rhizobium sp. BK251]
MINSTLTRRLFFRVAPVVAVTIALIAVFAFNSATREINKIYDAQLVNDTDVLLALLRRSLERPNGHVPREIPDIDFTTGNEAALSPDADEYADAHMFRGWVNGHVAVYSNNAPLENFPEQKAGFTTVPYKGDMWRIYSAPLPNTAITMEVGEKVSVREKLVANILLNLFFPLVALVPIIGFLIWLGINNGLSTIRGLVRHIRSRSPDDLSAIPVDGLPRDLLPLGNSINHLLDKLAHSLTLERRFSDLAAHQLRTPQAAMKLLLQLLDRADSEDERRAIISDLVLSNEHAMHMIEQLLRLARVSHHAIELAPVNLYDLAATVLSQFGNVISDRGMDVSLEGDEHAYVKTDELLLAMMFSNLVDNALKYTPVGGRIAVVVASEQASCRLSIRDSGPGIPPHQYDAVFQRFYRLDTLETEGSGLGLAIVADIADRLSAAITLATPSWGNGLQIDLLLARST